MTALSGRAVMRNFRVPIGCALAAAVVLVALAFNAPLVRAQSLSETLSATYQSNPRLLAERAALRATDEEVASALSGWRPTVS